MVQLKIKVTKEILERSMFCGYGTGPITSNCPIAFAIRDIFPKAQVGNYDFHAEPDIKSIPSIKLVKSASDFIKKFDRTSPAKRLYLSELEFTVDIPDAIIDRINIDEIRPLLTNHPTLELIEA